LKKLKVESSKSQADKWLLEAGKTDGRPLRSEEGRWESEVGCLRQGNREELKVTAKDEEDGRKANKPEKNYREI